VGIAEFTHVWKCSGDANARTISSESRAKPREPNWGTFADQAIPGTPPEPKSLLGIMWHRKRSRLFVAGPASPAPHNAGRHRTRRTSGNTECSNRFSCARFPMGKRARMSLWQEHAATAPRSSQSGRAFPRLCAN
jgi:hypothetical protein